MRARLFGEYLFGLRTTQPVLDRTRGVTMKREGVHAPLKILLAVIHRHRRRLGVLGNVAALTSSTPSNLL